MGTKSVFVAMVAALGLSVAAAANLITPVSQSRSVGASAEASGQMGSDSDSDSDFAIDFGRFNSTVTASANSGDSSGWGRGIQDSSILASQIIGVGSAESRAGGSLSGTGSGSASSSFDVRFRIDQTLSYTFDASASGQFSGSFPQFSSEILLTGPQGTLASGQTNENSNPVSISLSGKLFPGAYRLFADALSNAAASFGGGTESNSVSFSIDLDLMNTLPPGVPSPANVPGKEYSHHADIDASGALAPMQNLAWDGTGNTWNSIRYPVPPPPGGGPPPTGINVDAIASRQDYLFDSVVRDAAALLVTIDYGAMGAVQPVVSDYESIYFQSAGANSTAGIWAQGVLPGAPPTSEIHTAAVQASAVRDPSHQFEGLNPTGLEVWGPEVNEDTAVSNATATMFSTNDDRLYRVSVFEYDPTTGAVAPYIMQAQIIQAIGFAGTMQEAELIDLDALMVNDVARDGQFGPGDSILFSIAPLFDATGSILLYDGGEIWRWNFDDGPMGAAFLNHGGYVWDTQNSVSAIFGTLDENIGGLEAVPEPALTAAVACLLFMFVYRGCH